MGLSAVLGFFAFQDKPEYLQGQAEVTEYRVSSKVPGRIAKIYVKEGQLVKAGDTLALLEAPDIDVAILTEHLCLAAAEQGLGTCWVCNFDAPRVKELFALPEHIEPIVLLPLGYPADESVFEGEKKRKTLTEIYAHH